MSHAVGPCALTLYQFLKIVFIFYDAHSLPLVGKPSADRNKPSGVSSGFSLSLGRT